MVKIIAFYEDHWMAPGTDFAQWDHLCRSFGAELQMIRNWSEAIIPEGYPIIIADEEGTQESRVFDHPTDAVYVFGRSCQNLLVALPSCDYTIRIDTPEPISMFGVNAAAIILRDRN
jgi:hypothetical protein